MFHLATLIKFRQMKYLLLAEETERLCFRLLEKSDFDSWLPFFQDPATSQFLGLGEMDSAHEKCEFWFELVERRYQQDTGGMNALIDKSTGHFIGQCGLLVQEVDGITELEVGYSLLPAFWNKGYATEAARKCRDYAFHNGFAESLISIIHIDNISSEMVAIKNGMKVQKQTVFKKMPVNIFRIDKSDWLLLGDK
jgi:[ribosomal protein S5]-alanine N-acetyltransferase